MDKWPVALLSDVNDRSNLDFMATDQLELLQQCSLCLELRPPEEFHRSTRDGRQRWCKACRRVYDCEYHARTKPIRLAQKAEAKAARLVWLHKEKSKPCADCRRTFHPSAMQFDHLPGCEKVRDVSTLVMRGCMTMARAEILKCDLVCANCHAVRTYIRRLGIEPTQPSICEPPAFYAMYAQRLRSASPGVNWPAQTVERLLRSPRDQDPDTRYA